MATPGCAPRSTGRRYGVVSRPVPPPKRGPMTNTENRNTYLDQVVAQQARLEQDLRSSRPAAAASFAPPPPPPGAPMAPAPKRARVAAQAVSDVPAGGGAPVTGARQGRATGVGRVDHGVGPPD